jgi:hypothetical protein
LVIILLSGCDKYEKLGLCAHPINPSLHDYQFAVTGGSVEVTTEDAHWNFDYYDSFSEDKVTVERGHLPGDSDKYNESILLLQSDWFSVSRQSQTKIVVIFQPNTTGQERKLELGLEDLSCLDRLTFTQSAD